MAVDERDVEAESRREAGADRASLRRHKAVASGLLVLMAGLMVAGRFLPPGYWVRLVGAGARAGFVGGLADWFAVTALFRRPLGLPIPHTAIIPRQKARLGAALGRFVANHVFTEADIAGMVGRLDLPALLGGVLADPGLAGPAARTLAAWLPRLLGTMADGRAGRLLARLVPRLLGGNAGGKLAARALRLLVEGGRHQEVFGFVLEQLQVGLAAQEETLRATIEDRVREQGGRLVGWAIGASVAKRVLAAVNGEFAKMEPHGSDVRAAFDEWARREIARMEEDPAHAAEIGAAIRRAVDHETVRAWVGDVWGRLVAALAHDAGREESRVAAVLQTALGDMGRMLGEDAGTRARLQAALAGVMLRTLPELRVHLARFIGDVVAGWDTKTITERLELKVGRDLQFVRMNGTVVGFLAGLVLYALLGGGN